MEDMGAISLTNLTKTYRNGRGVRDLTLNIESGQVFGLLGPNGSGKSTAMKLMTGLLHPDEGTVSIFDADVQNNREQALIHVGSMIEAPSLHPYLTARQNLSLIQNLSTDCLTTRIDHVLALVRLTSYTNDKVSSFSMGMKQRLGLAMALLPNPDLLILDEPTNGLDIEGVAEFRDIIKGQVKAGKTILLSSHIADEVERICTDVAIISEGKLKCTANVDKLLEKYESVEQFYLDFIRAEGGLAS